MVDFAVDVSCGALLMTSPKAVYHCTAGVRLNFIDRSGHGVESYSEKLPLIIDRLEPIRRVTFGLYDPIGAPCQELEGN